MLVCQRFLTPVPNLQSPKSRFRSLRNRRFRRGTPDSPNAPVTKPGFASNATRDATAASLSLCRWREARRSVEPRGDRIERILAGAQHLGNTILALVEDVLHLIDPATPVAT